MKVYFNKQGQLDYIDCTSDEFVKIQDFFKINDWSDLPECLGKTVLERIEKYLDLRQKGFTIINSHKKLWTKNRL